MIQSRGVNAIHSVGSMLLLGTMYGLLILDTFERKWELISTQQGLSDAAVWDIIEHDGSVYLATAKGINEFSIKDNRLIPLGDSELMQLSNQNIYDLENDLTSLYIAAESGLYIMKWGESNLSLLSKRMFTNITIEDGGISGNDGQLIVIRDGVEHIYHHEVTAYTFCDKFLWRSIGRALTLTDTITHQSWEYGTEDGIPGNTVYSLHCEGNWVQFLTNNGVAYYNWTNYHEF